MNKSFFSIQLKVAAGLLLIAMLFLANAIATYTFSQRIFNSLNRDFILRDKAAWQLSELRALVIQSQLYTSDWIYRQKEIGGKLALRKIQGEDFATLQLELQQVAASLEKEGQIETAQLLDEIIRRADTLFAAQKIIMQTLNADIDYEDPIKRFESETLYNAKIAPLANGLAQRLDQMIAQERAARNKILTNDVMNVLSAEKSFELIAAIFVITVAIFIWQFSSYQITKPIRAIERALGKLSAGEIPPPIAAIPNDELGEIAKAINQLIGGLSKLSEFAAQIGNGNYDVSYAKLGENDALGNSLLNMRDNLKQISIEDARRNWANEGAARFGDLLRANSGSIPNLTKAILSELVKYVEANQGCFFVIDQYGQEPRLELMATFAWNRQRIRNKYVTWGEGLVGQAWAEKDLLFITEVPQNYIEIGSGLGDANPKNIVVVPLIFNEEVYGVIELASFSVLPRYKVDFLKRIAENIASTLAATFVAERTQRLLQESQSISEQLRVQEEEMRQNLEELLSTQEQSQRNMKIAQSSSDSLEMIIESMPDAIIQTDANWHILKVNDKLCQMTGYAREALAGTDIVRLAKQLNPVLLKSGETYRQEITRKDRSTFMAEMNVHRLRDDEFVIYIRNMDEQIKKDREIEQLKKELERFRQTQR